VSRVEVVARPAAGPRTRSRPSTARLVGVLAAHSLQSFLRTPVAAFFTVIFPLSFLVIVGSSVRDQVITDHVYVSQVLVPSFAVFGVAMEAFCILPTGTARLRESGVLKRLRGTPAPPGTVMAGRIAAAVVIGLASVAILATVGVVGYHLQIVWPKVPAALVTLLLGIGCLAALGLAVVALTRSVVAVQALTLGILIPLSFISGVFIVDADLPPGLDALSRALPLRHLADALRGTFDPLTPGSGFAWGDLAVLTLWGVAGTAVALARFGWEPRLGERRRAAAGTFEPEASGGAPGGVPARALTVTAQGRPRRSALLAVETRHAVVALFRNRSPLFFSIVFPVLLLLLFPAVFPGATAHGLPIADFMLPGAVVYAAAVAGYVNMTEQVAGARAAGVVERVRATPLPLSTYLSSQVLSAGLVSLATALALVGVAVTVNGSPVPGARLPGALAVVLLTTLCFSVLGLALLCVVPSIGTTTAITLGTLLPLTFVSDVFYLGPALPRALQVVGDVLPLKHAMYALLDVLSPAVPGLGDLWWHVAVVAAWTAAGALVVLRRWERALQG